MKGVFPMRHQQTQIICVIAVISLIFGCKESSKDNGGDGGGAGTDTRPPEGDGGVGTETASSEETGSDSATVATDTGVSPEEKPPITPPDRCRLVTYDKGGNPVGQRELTGGGDGRRPDIVYNDGVDSALISWAYFPSLEESGDRWEVLVAPYGDGPAEEDAGVADGGDNSGGGVGDARNPATMGPLAELPRLVSRDNEFAVVWLDGRFDPSCRVESYPDCLKDVVFLRLNADGGAVSDPPEPVRISAGGSVTLRPDIAAIPSGYAVAWVEWMEGGTRLMAARIDDAGQVLASWQLSTDDVQVDSVGDVSIAADEERLVAVWASGDRRQLLARAWRHADLAPEAAPRAIGDQVTDVQNTRIVAGAGGFLIAWASDLNGDHEIFTQKLDAVGQVVGTVQRVTWTTDDVRISSLASNGALFALAWSSTQSNGTSTCAEGTCNEQVFGALLGQNGAPASAPVQLSDDPNTSTNPEISWDGSGWSTVWEMRGNLRWRVLLAQMVCE